MEDNKVFNDPIHKSVKMPPYCQVIIDTPEFQRLRFIKQLGCTCYVFPSAVHTRFEHSLGVSHLAGKLANMLRQDDPKIDMTNTDVICVQIAGLCHDLGHGPFSYVFEDIVPTNKDGKKWSHKEQSIIMFEHLIKENKLNKKLADYGIHQHEIDFICDLILGRPRGKGSKLLSENSFYLHQIVNNSVNKIDVNSWDYIARDALYLGINSAFDFSRITPFIKVLEVERKEERNEGKTRRELCFRDKVANDLNQMLLTRRRLHYAAYQHRVTKIISIMLKDALRAASDHLTFEGKAGVKYSLLDSVKDPMAFCQVNDTIVNEIMRSTSQEPGIVKAQAIINRIHNKRQLYQCIGTWQHDGEEPIDRHTLDPAKIKQEITKNNDELWHSENIEVEVSYFDYGDGGKNPLLNIPFYKKSDRSTGRGIFLPEKKLSVDLPELLEDLTVTVYTKVPNVSQEILKNAMNRGNSRLHRIIDRIISPSGGKKRTRSFPGITTKRLKISSSGGEGKEMQSVKPIVKRPLDEPTESKTLILRSHAQVKEEKDDSLFSGELFIDLTAEASDTVINDDITVTKVRETPARLPHKKNEAVITYGLQLTSSGSKPMSSVKIKMPHCAMFTNPKEAEIVFYTRDNDSGKFTRLSSAALGATSPRCVVRKQDLDLHIDHFSEWWIVAVIRSYFIGKRFICTPYIPETLCLNKEHCIYLFLTQDIGLKEVPPPRYKQAFVDEEFPVKWGKGNLTITLMEDDMEVKTEILEEVALYHRSRSHIPFTLKARGARNSRAVLTFNLKQNIKTKVQFHVDFEGPTPTHSYQEPSTSSQTEDRPRMLQQRPIEGLSDRQLDEISEALGNHYDLHKLALNLGISLDQWHDQYQASNTSRGGRIINHGTRQMLMDWRRKTSPNEQIPELRKALIKSGYAELEGDHFGSTR